MIDFISNNLTCLRNSNLAKHDSVNIKYSKLTVEILNILKREGYIRDYQIDNNDIKVTVSVDLNNSMKAFLVSIHILLYIFI